VGTNNEKVKARVGGQTGNDVKVRGGGGGKAVLMTSSLCGGQKKKRVTAEGTVVSKKEIQGVKKMDKRRRTQPPGLT